MKCETTVAMRKVLVNIIGMLKTSQVGYFVKQLPGKTMICTDDGDVVHEVMLVVLTKVYRYRQNAVGNQEKCAIVGWTNLPGSARSKSGHK